MADYPRLVPSVADLLRVLAMVMERTACTDPALVAAAADLATFGTGRAAAMRVLRVLPAVEGRPEDGTVERALTVFVRHLARALNDVGSPRFWSREARTRVENAAARALWRSGYGGDGDRAAVAAARSLWRRDDPSPGDGSFRYCAATFRASLSGNELP